MLRKARMPKTLQIGDVIVPGQVLMAPMTGVTDLPFRVLASRLGAAYVATEMVAAKELARARPDVVRRAAVGAGLPLTVIQLVGRDPEQMAQGARMAEKAGADIVDLNFGCPAKEVTGSAAGSALMRTPDLGVSDHGGGGPGDGAAGNGQDASGLGRRQSKRRRPGAARRTGRGQGGDGPRPHPQTVLHRPCRLGCGGAVKAAVAIPVIVNGDIITAEAARQALAQSGADGLMLGGASTDAHGWRRIWSAR